jgi:hypothetical protein
VITVRWSRTDFFGFASTWSAYRRLIELGRTDPLPLLATRLDSEGLWAEDERRTVQFAVHMRVGRATGS